MKPTVDRSLVAAFGSETRVLTLAALANSSVPLTAYRAAKIAGLRPPKVYEEIRRAKANGLVGQVGGKVTLLDPDIRDLLRRRVRIFGLGDWLTEKDRREVSRKAIADRLQTLPSPRFRRERGWAPRAPEIYQRDPKKDRTLRSMGLRVGSHD
jgi:DNA-binding transcriptional ArsR family regulator